MKWFAIWNSNQEKQNSIKEMEDGKQENQKLKQEIHSTKYKLDKLNDVNVANWGL